MVDLSSGKQLDLHRIESFEAHMGYVRQAYLEPMPGAVGPAPMCGWL
jgi:hypothetical protein